jgi:DNA-binding NtrC family response regulator
MAALMAHDWPGNVRELENTIHRALVLTTDTVIGARALELGPPTGGSPQFAAAAYVSRPETHDYAARSEKADDSSRFFGRPLHLVERDVIIGTLQLTDGNRTRTASMLGLSIRALRNKIGLYTAQGIHVPASSAARMTTSGINAGRVGAARTP